MRLGQKGSVEREGWESGSVLCVERWPSDGGQWQFVADGEHRGGGGWGGGFRRARERYGWSQPLMWKEAMRGR